MGAGLGVLGAGLGVQARRQQVWQQALGRAGTARACADGAGVRGRRGARGRARRERQVRRAAGKARTRGGARQGAAGRAGRAAGRHAGVRQARGARSAGWPGRSLCAQAGPAGPGWGFVHSDSVFFGLVRLGSFLSHQMNTVHCKINFSKKKIFIKLNKNQIKFDKIFEK